VPEYDYTCCGDEWFAFHSVENRNKERCPKCGNRAKKLVSFITVQRPFVPKVCENFGDEPVMIHSRAHFREECRKHGRDPADCDINPGRRKERGRRITIG
jgi:hypothetical protein